MIIRLILLIIYLVISGCAINHANNKMKCRSDADCGYGYSCRSILGGGEGTECKLKPQKDVRNMFFEHNCQVGIDDCGYGYSCEPKQSGGAECKEIRSSHVTNTPELIHSTINTPPKISEPIINNLDQVKNKCIELGFKLNSEKFGKCILELTK